MSKELLTNILSTTGTIALAVSYIPQIITLYKVKSAEGQSISFWVILLISLISLAGNMIVNENPFTVVFPQLLNIALAGIVFGQVIYYKKRGN